MRTSVSWLPSTLWHRLYWAVSDTLVVARRHLLHIPREPEQIISATFQPIVMVLLFRYIFGGAIEVSGIPYVDYLMAGIFVQSIVMEGMTGGITLAYDLKQGIVDRFRTLPMTPVAVVAGPIVADLVRGLCIVGVLVSVGLAVGFRPRADASGWLIAIGLLLATSFTVSWIGAVVALLVRDPQAVQTTVFVVLMPLAFGSSAFVPVETMPAWLQPVVRDQPVSVVVDAVRATLLGQSVGHPLWHALMWCGAIVAICLVLSATLYRNLTRG